jgi:hypothetical protein
MYRVCIKLKRQVALALVLLRITIKSICVAGFFLETTVPGEIDSVNIKVNLSCSIMRYICETIFTLLTTMVLGMSILT